VKCPLFLPDFGKTWIFYTVFEKYSKICSMPTDGHD